MAIISVGCVSSIKFDSCGCVADATDYMIKRTYVDGKVKSETYVPYSYLGREVAKAALNSLDDFIAVLEKLIPIIGANKISHAQPYPAPMELKKNTIFQ